MQPAAGFGRLVSKQGLRRTVRSYNPHFIVMVLGSQSIEEGSDLFQRLKMPGVGLVKRQKWLAC